MCLASLLMKIQKSESFDEEDWNNIVELTFIAAIWLYQNSSIQCTPETNQVHFQPKSKKKKKKTKE